MRLFSYNIVQVVHLHSAAHGSSSFQILSVCTLIDEQNEQISAREIGQFCKKTLFKTKRKTYLSFQVSNAYT